jgi:hypothetical protein
MFAYAQDLESDSSQQRPFDPYYIDPTVPMDAPPAMYSDDDEEVGRVSQLCVRKSCFCHVSEIFCFSLEFSLFCWVFICGRKVSFERLFKEWVTFSPMFVLLQGMSVGENVPDGTVRVLVAEVCKGTMLLHAYPADRSPHKSGRFDKSATNSIPHG